MSESEGPERKAKRQLQEVAIFNDVAKALTSSLNLDSILQTIMDKMAEFFRPDTWSLLMVDEQKDGGSTTLDPDDHVFDAMVGGSFLPYLLQIAREKGEVTIDDVRSLCPPPADADPRIMGSVFLIPDFERVGYRNSGRAACHGRTIGVFRLRGR